MGAGATETEVPSVSSELLNNATQEVCGSLYYTRDTRAMQILKIKLGTCRRSILVSKMINFFGTNSGSKISYHISLIN